MTYIVVARSVTAALFALFLSTSAAFAYQPAIGEEGSWWWSGPGGQGGEASVKRSPSDDRLYRYVQLDNGLRVLLISDLLADKAAAALNVNVGSFQNPLDRAGLAHFLEHMLFLGTDRYPEAGAYQLFVSEHGGRHNAYTGMEDTNYFFDIEAKHLMAALDRFSRFFIAPLLDVAYVERERNAVEAEFRLKLKDDSRREWEILSEQIDPEHPLSRFSVGNLDTLADRKDRLVRADLVAFYQRYYSAERMTLVVLGRETLDQLEQAVRQRFADIPGPSGESNVDSPNSLHDQAVPTFKIKRPAQLHILPVKDERSLSLVFPMPGLAQHWRTKPALYWGHILGDESKGSLLADLKRAGLANGLAAGLSLDSAQGALFVIKVGLTPSGVDQQDQVLDRLFAWLKVARESGLARWRFEELAVLQQASFRFLEKSAPVSYVQHLGNALRLYPPADVLQGPYVLSKFDKSVLSDFASRLRPENALIMLVAPEVEKADRFSKFYGGPYRTVPVADTTHRRWRQIETNKLSLAGRNPYLANSYPVSGKNNSTVAPVKLLNQKGLVVWHYADQQFGSPQGIFEVRVASTALGECRAMAQTELYLALVEDALTEETYQAGLAGLNYSLDRWNNSISLNMVGYVERQQKLLAEVLIRMVSPNWEVDDFRRIKLRLSEYWRNSRKQWPVHQLIAHLTPLIKADCSDEDLAKALESVTFASMPTFVDRLYRETKAQFYIGGALSEEQALAMVCTTNKILNLTNVGDANLREKIAALPEKALRHDIHVDHPDHSVLVYIQGDEDSLRERAHMALIKTIFEASFYTNMRTEKQLGYVVGANVSHMNRVPGVVMYIQSPHTSSAQLETEISKFINTFEKDLKNLTEDELDRFKYALLANIEEKPQNVLALVARHQESLDLDYVDFQFRDELVRQIKTIDREGILSTYQRLFVTGSRQLWLRTLQETTGVQQLAHDDIIKLGPKVFNYVQ